MNLDDFSHLCDEIAMLIRAGVPLDAGLRQFGRDESGQMGIHARRIAERLEQGQSLDEALAGDGDPTIPDTCRAMLRAGLRLGQPDAVLVMIADAARRIRSARRRTLIVLTYPMILLSMASLILWAFSRHFLPGVISAIRDFTTQGGFLPRLLEAAGSTADIWGPLIPGVCVVLFVVLLRAHRRSSGLASDSVGMRVFSKVPWLGEAIRESRVALWHRLMSLLLQCRVPLDESLELTSAALGDRRLTAASKSAISQLRAGRRPAEVTLDEPGSLPVRKLLLMFDAPGDGTGGDRSAHLIETLRRSSDMYRRRAARNSRLACTLLPAMITVFVGGGITLVFTVSMFGSFIQVLHTLAVP